MPELRTPRLHKIYWYYLGRLVAAIEGKQVTAKYGLYFRSFVLSGVRFSHGLLR